MKWEYKILDIGNVLRGKVDDSKLDLRMNELGTEEWELVTTFTTGMGAGFTRGVVAVFKRPKQ